MESSELILCDTNILIELYKNNSSIIAELKKIGQPNLSISIVTAGELIYGAINKRELGKILKDIAHLNLLHIDKLIGELHIELISHNLTLPDALIAATALHHAIPLYTLNKKDFRYIPELKLHMDVDL